MKHDRKKGNSPIPWKFEKNMLISPNGEMWRASSGPYGKGKLPSGQYRINKVVIIDATDKTRLPYCDKIGFAWWCKLTPLFKTDRYGFGIHPDGNIPGTRGCIGVRLNDSHPVYEALCVTDEFILIVV